METTENTFESVWKVIHENERILKENHAETERILNEKFAETAQAIKETQQSIKDTDSKLSKKIKALAKMTGGLSLEYGSFAEEFFFNAFKKGKKDFFGETFDKIKRNNVGKGPGEYDIMMINGKYVAVIEVKFKAREKYVAEVLKKSKTFRINFPKYSSHKLFLGLAAMVFPEDIEEDCIDAGIAVIKQVGDTVVIVDKNMTAF
jgi:hypothetical protein